MMQYFTDLVSSEALELSLFVTLGLGFVGFRSEAGKKLVTMASKRAGPPLCVLALGLLVELLFWVLNIPAHSAEVWGVVLAGLALSLLKPCREDKIHKKCLATKDVDYDGESSERAPKQNPSSSAFPLVKEVPVPGFPGFVELIKHKRGSAKTAGSGHKAPRKTRTDELAKSKSRIEALVKCGDIQGAEAILLELVEQAQVDVVTCSMIISAWAKNGEPQRACKLLEHLLDSHAKLDIASFNSAIDACARSGDVRGAERC